MTLIPLKTSILLVTVGTLEMKHSTHMTSHQVILWLKLTPQFSYRGNTLRCSPLPLLFFSFRSPKRKTPPCEDVPCILLSDSSDEQVRADAATHAG